MFNLPQLSCQGPPWTRRLTALKLAGPFYSNRWLYSSLPKEIYCSQMCSKYFRCHLLSSLFSSKWRKNDVGESEEDIKLFFEQIHSDYFWCRKKVKVLFWIFRFILRSIFKFAKHLRLQRFEQDTSSAVNLWANPSFSLSWEDPRFKSNPCETP